MPVTLIDPQGVSRTVDGDAAVAAALSQGWRAPTLQDASTASTEAALEHDYGGVGGVAKATAASVGRGISLGLTDVAARALGGDEAAETLRKLKERHPYLSTGGEIAGMIIPTIVTGGANLPAGAAARAGAGVAESLGGRLLGRAIGGAVEGGLYGVGQGVSELALSDQPLTLEHVASSLSSNALYGAALGGGLGVASRAAEVGLSRAKGAIDSALERRAAADLARGGDAATIATADLQHLDAPGLSTARSAELETIDAARVPERQQFVDDLAAFRQATKDDRIWQATEGASDRATRELGKTSLEADKQVDRLLRNPIALAEKPERALAALQQQQHALQEIAKLREEAVRAFEEAPQRIRAEIHAGKVKGYVGSALSPRGLDLAVEREMTARFGASTEAKVTADTLKPEQIDWIKQHAIDTNNTGLRTSAEHAVSTSDNPFLAGARDRARQQLAEEWNRFHAYRRPARLQAFDKLPAALERNQTLQAKLGQLAAEPASERLAAIDAELAARGAPKEPSLGGALLGAALPFAGPLGAAVHAAQHVTGGFRKVIAAATTRTGKAVSSFLDVSSKVASKAPVATKVLAAVAYAQRDAVKQQGLSQPAEHKDPGSLPALYRQRTDEIKSQIQIAPDGSFQMKRAARATMAARFDGLRAHDPVAADRLETLGARRIEWLASQIPRRPDLAGVATGPDRYQPSDLVMRSFARKVLAVEDPHGVIERLGSGRITPEDAAAVRAVYPELMAEVTQQIMSELPRLRKTLPYARRLALSIFSGVPVDPAMTPSVIRTIQAMYASEPGTAGGTQAPVPQPQFGSVTRDKGTLAQQRQGL